MSFIGVEVDVAGQGRQTIKAKLICALVDLPAKAMLMNCNQYNGAFGCSSCKHPGSVVST